VFCVDLRTKRDYFPVQHLLVVFMAMRGVFRDESVYLIQAHVSRTMVQQLVVSLSPQRNVFDPRPLHVRFVM
jgi:hypothetical protein